MRVKVLRNIGHATVQKGEASDAYEEGCVYEVPNDEADKLIKASLAEQTDEPVTPKKKKVAAATPAETAEPPAATPSHPKGKQ